MALKSEVPESSVFKLLEDLSTTMRHIRGFESDDRND